MLEAHSKREALELATQVKNAMISGLWSNPNFDDNKQTRRRAIEEIESNHKEVIKSLYGRIIRDEDLEEHPFFAAMKLDEVPSDTPIPRPHDTEEIKPIGELDQT
jgi:hypothetical protein